MKLEFETQCDMDWDEMKGGDRRRFCESCHEHVHHISHMTKDEALKFLQDRDYQVCVDFYCDSDDQAVFREKSKRLAMQKDGLKQLLAAAVAVIPLALAAAFIDFDKPADVAQIVMADPTSPPLLLDGPTPVVVNATPGTPLMHNTNVWPTHPPEPVVQDVVETPAPVAETKPEPPKVIRPIRHLRGKIRRPSNLDL